MLTGATPPPATSLSRCDRPGGRSLTPRPRRPLTPMGACASYDPDMVREPDDFEFDFDEDSMVEPIRRSRTVRWTAIVVVASFALAGLSSLSHWW